MSSEVTLETHRLKGTDVMTVRCGGGFKQLENESSTLKDFKNKSFPFKLCRLTWPYVAQADWPVLEIWALDLQLHYHDRFIPTLPLKNSGVLSFAGTNSNLLITAM